MPVYQNVLGYAILYKFWCLWCVFYHISSKWEGETIMIFMYNYDINYMMHYVSMKMLQKMTVRE